MDGWEPPGPGPWQQDAAHNPACTSQVVREIFPVGFNRGFTETFARYGVLLDTLAIAAVNGFLYHQPRPFDAPGPDGPPTPEQIGEEIGRRAQLAADALGKRIWRQDLTEWDTVRKPASIARQRELGAVDLAALDTEGLLEHLRACAGLLEEMVYQHHRHNMAAMLPVGDFLLQAGELLGRPPTSLFGVLDGYSPVSSIRSPEVAAAVEALEGDDEARRLVTGEGDPAERLAALRARVPAVDDYAAIVGLRPVEGFDVLSPTLLERPDLLLAKLAAALDADDVDEARRRADAFADELRSELSGDDLVRFDDLLAEARLVYRLRDERGLYSDMPAIGLLRLAVLEAGRRLAADGHLHDATHLFDAGFAEILELVAAPRPVGDELAARAATREAATEAGAPRFLGTPPPPPPPLDLLPPPLARIMGATGFLIEGILGELDEPAGTDRVVVGIPASGGVAEGSARLVRTPEDLLDVEDGDVLVAAATGEAVNSVLHLLVGIVTDHGSFASHAGIVAREMGFPAVVGTVDATRRIRPGDRVRVDGTAGEVTVLG